MSFKITAGGATVRSKETVLEVSRKTIGLTNPSQLHDWFSAADLADMETDAIPSQESIRIQ